MNLSSTFNAEVFRPIATIAVPGSFAILPYVLIATHKYEGLILFWDKHEATFIVIITLIVIAVGLVLENLGSEIEARIWDPLCKKSNSCHDTNWYKYLRKAFAVEPIGQRYLRTIILRMKFELGFSVSLIPFWIGMIWLNCIKLNLSKNTMIWASVGVAILFIYMLFASYCSSKLLGKLRAELIKEECAQQEGPGQS
jgi:hypothetical protein